MNNLPDLITLKLSIQRALAGNVTCNLAAVTCRLQPNRVLIRAYFSGTPSEEDVERIQIIGSEVAADMPETYMVEDESISIDDRPEEMLDFWAFRRAETSR